MPSTTSRTQAAQRQQRRWSIAGRKLQHADPGRFAALLALTEGLVRHHRRQAAGLMTRVQRKLAARRR